MFETMDTKPEIQEEEIEEDVAECCDVYAEYTPCHLKLGSPHPIQLCEGSALSCVIPPVISYNLKMNKGFFTKVSEETPHLSNAQMEAVLYCCQSHESYIEVEGKKMRKGFLIGDGTGVGKSRELAAIIHEYALQGLEDVVWVSTNYMLLKDVEKEVSCFDSNRKVIQFNEKMGDMRGVTFMTYTDFTKKSKRTFLTNKLGPNYKGLLIFDEAHAAKSAHGIKESICGLFVIELQEKYPEARVVYSTATGASEVHHLAYLTRLGIWGSGTKYKTEKDFSLSMTTRGVAALELLSMDLKRRGVFLSRQISFEGVIVECVNVPNDELFEKIWQRSSQLWILLLKFVNAKDKEDMKNLNEQGEKAFGCTARLPIFYGAALQFFATLIMSSKVKSAVGKTMEALKKGQSVVIGIQKTGGAGMKDHGQARWTNGKPFSNAAHSLKSAMIMAGIPIGCPKVYKKGESDYVKIGDWSAAEEKEVLKKQKEKSIKVVLESEDNFGDDTDEIMDSGSESDGDEYTAERDTPKAGPSSSMHSQQKVPSQAHCSKKPKLNEEINLFLTYATGTFLKLGQAVDMSWTMSDVNVLSKEVVSEEELARMYHELYPFLPVNPVDELLSRIESSHRQSGDKRPAKDLIANGTGSQSYYTLKYMNWTSTRWQSKETEIDLFMSQKKRICIISDASSVGVSLHADKSCKNQQQRVHITLEYGWSPDKVVQQLGRTHRSNQAHKPMYVILKSNVPGEARFVTIVARRLCQMGALCQASTEANLLSKAMSDSLSSDLAERAILGSQGKLSTGFENGRLCNLLRFWGTGDQDDISIKTTNASYIMKNRIKVMTRFFNRCLILELKKQRLFVNEVTKNIQQLITQGAKVYTPIIEYPPKSMNLTVTLTKSTEFKFNRVGSVFVKTFCMSRILEWKCLQNIVQGKSVKYATGDGLVVCLLHRDSNNYDAYFPYNCTSVVKRKSTFKDWQNPNNLTAESKWNFIAKELRKRPGCIHKTIRGSCAKERKCTVNFGCLEINMVCGSTYNVMSELEGIFDDPFQLAKITESNDRKSVGLVIETNKEQRVVDMLTQLKM